MAVKRVIALSGTHGPEGMPMVLDDSDTVADAAIRPGDLLKITTTGVAKNTDAADDVAQLFALERDELGNDIDDNYATGDQVKVGAFSPGQRVLAWIASGINVSKGTYLTGDNVGRLTTSGVADGVRLAVSLEELTPTADTRVRVQLV
jgi:hypothetical protein